jgi:hypothetical protein
MGAVANLTPSFARSCWCYYDIIKWRQDDGSVYFCCPGRIWSELWCLPLLLVMNRLAKVYELCSTCDELEFVRLGWVQVKLSLGWNSEDWFFCGTNWCTLLILYPFADIVVALVWKLHSSGVYNVRSTMFLVTIGFSLGALLQGTEHNFGAEPDSVVLWMPWGQDVVAWTF